MLDILKLVCYIGAVQSQVLVFSNRGHKPLSNKLPRLNGFLQKDGLVFVLTKGLAPSLRNYLTFCIQYRKDCLEVYALDFFVQVLSTV